MKTNAIHIALVCVLAIAPLHAYGGGKRTIAKAVVAKLLARDAARDAASAARAKAIKSPTAVWRYTTAEQARRELKSGIRAGSHFTPSVTRGRAPSPATAQRQYGLPQAPEVRMTVLLDKGRVVLRNKALGGTPGRGEVVPVTRVSPGAIYKVLPLSRRPTFRLKTE